MYRMRLAELLFHLCSLGLDKEVERRLSLPRPIRWSRCWRLNTLPWWRLRLRCDRYSQLLRLAAASWPALLWPICCFGLVFSLQSSLRCLCPFHSGGRPFLRGSFSSGWYILCIVCFLLFATAVRRFDALLSRVQKMLELRSHVPYLKAIKDMCKEISRCMIQWLIDRCLRIYLSWVILPFFLNAKLIDLNLSLPLGNGRVEGGKVWGYLCNTVWSRALNKSSTI